VVRRLRSSRQTKLARSAAKSPFIIHNSSIIIIFSPPCLRELRERPYPFPVSRYPLSVGCEAAVKPNWREAPQNPHSSFINHQSSLSFPLRASVSSVRDLFRFPLSVGCEAAVKQNPNSSFSIIFPSSAFRIIIHLSHFYLGDSERAWIIANKSLKYANLLTFAPFYLIGMQIFCFLMQPVKHL